MLGRAPRLDGLDAVDWSALTHAYGPATDLSALLRQAAAESAEEADEALQELWGCSMHQGTVYPATAAAVPFLVELARTASTNRDVFTYFVGMLADGRHAYGTALPQVQAAVAAHARELEALLADPDPGVRVSAAYAVAQAGGAADPLWTRWVAEDDPAARASLLLALAKRDPERAADAATRAVLEGTPPERVAAGLALVRLHQPWPDGAVAAVVAALGDGGQVFHPWAEEPARDLMVDAADERAHALLTALTTAPQARVRHDGVWGMIARIEVWRGEPARLLPTIWPLLRDPDKDVRWAVVVALRESGRRPAGTPTTSTGSRPAIPPPNPICPLARHWRWRR